MDQDHSPQVPIPDRDLQPGALKPGDVLLSYNQDGTGHLITTLDGGRFCHAALYAGDEQVIEAVPFEGVHQLSLADHLSERMTVTVFRHVNGDAIGQDAVAFALARCRDGQPYGLSDVMFQAFLVLRNGMDSRLGEARDANRRAMMDSLAQLRASERLPERCGTSCSQLVATAYHEAPPSPQHALRFLIDRMDTARSTDVEHGGDELTQLSRDLVTAYAKVHGLEDPSDPFRKAGEELPGGRWPLYMVSTRDLETSPSLLPRGYLKREVALPGQVSAPDEPRAAGGSTPRRRAEAAPATMTSAHGSISDNTPTLAAPAARSTTPKPASIRKRGPTRLLFVGSSPRNQPQVNVDVEFDLVQQRLLASMHRDSFELTPPLLRPDLSALSSALQLRAPDVVHFVGHGEDNALLLLDLAGDGASTPADELGWALEGREPALLVLNACDSAQLARSLTSRVGASIGIDGKLTMSQGARFAATLYAQLGDGRTLANAFAIAAATLRGGIARAQLFGGRQDPEVMCLAGEDHPAATTDPPEPPTRRVYLKRGVVLALTAVAGVAALTGSVLVGSKAPPDGGSEPTALRVIRGGRLTAGSTLEDAMAAYATCQRSYAARNRECRPLFELSVFAREVGLPAVQVPDFQLERHEVTTAQFVGFLNREAQQLRVVESAEALSQAHVPAPAVMQGNRWLAFVATSRDEEPSVSVDYRDGGFAPRAGYEDLPMRSVSFAGANAYCKALGRRLPTSDEWELAARGAGPEPRRYPWGENPPSCGDAIFGRGEGEPCATANAPPGPAPVGKRSDVSPEGIFDLGGNVSEWTATPFEAPSVRVVRGGNYEDLPVMMAGARRFRVPETGHRRQLGFRCAVDSKAPDEDHDAH